LFFFLKLSPLHLYYLLPIIVMVTLYLAIGRAVTIINLIVIGAIYYFSKIY